VSLFFLGTIVGCLTGGPLNQQLGPRRVFLCCSPIAALTWAMIATSQKVWVVYLARIMSGFLFGTFQANGKVYNAEIAHPDLRGSLETMILNMLALGTI
jgi:MFS family permease